MEYLVLPVCRLLAINEELETSRLFYLQHLGCPWIWNVTQLSPYLALVDPAVHHHNVMLSSLPLLWCHEITLWNAWVFSVIGVGVRVSLACHRFPEVACVCLPSRGYYPHHNTHTQQSIFNSLDWYPELSPSSSPSGVSRTGTRPPAHVAVPFPQTIYPLQTRTDIHTGSGRW